MLIDKPGKPKALPVPSPLPSLVIPGVIGAFGNNAELTPPVGLKSCEEEGDCTMRSAGGSMSRDVRKEVSARSSEVDVTDKNMSSNFC